MPAVDTGLHRLESGDGSRSHWRWPSPVAPTVRNNAQPIQGLDHDPVDYPKRTMFEELLDRRDVVIVDTETTGFDANAQVIQVALLNTRGEPLMNELVRAKEEIPAGATQMHGWTRRKLRRHGARRWARVYPKLRKRLERANAVLAWNAPFDERMISQTCTSHGLPGPRCEWQCCMQMYRHLRPGLRYSLIEAATQEGVQVAVVHDALADCQTALAVMQAVVDAGGDKDTNSSRNRRGCLGFAFR